MAEHVSEKISKTPGGRPRAFDEGELQRIRMLFPDLRSERQVQTRAYAQRALVTLMNDDRFRWLCDPEAMTRGDPGSWKPALLAELGRISDQAALQAVALQLCELKPTTAEAVKLVRQYRSGGRAARPGRVLDLTAALCRAADAYLERHQPMTWEQVRTALEQCLDACRSVFAPDGEDPITPLVPDGEPPAGVSSITSDPSTGDNP